MALISSSNHFDHKWQTKGGFGGGQTNSLQFLYTGSAQNWTVPSGVTVIHCWLLGGGGGGGYATNRNYGGAGGFTEGTIAVTPAETLSIMVGSRGTTRLSGSGERYGGGGGISHGHNCSTGAGRSAIFRGSDTNISNSTELATAGGGGGGGEDFPHNNHAGAGGGLIGQTPSYGVTTDRATGGTQSSKGTQAGNANSDLGGERCRGGHGGTVPAAGGGGGGYYGGGAGRQDEGGAGGSGYIGGMISGSTWTGDSIYAPFDGDYGPLHTANGPNSIRGRGHTGQASNGYHGYVLIAY